MTAETKWCKPWLPVTHPNFMVALAGPIIACLWSALIGFADHGATDAASLDRTNQFAAPGTWAWAFMVCGVLMVVGLFRTTFTLTRVAIAMSLVVWLIRFGLLAQADAIDMIPTGFALPIYAGLILPLFAQTLEPPDNPVTRRDT